MNGLYLITLMTFPGKNYINTFHNISFDYEFHSQQNSCKCKIKYWQKQTPVKFGYKVFLYNIQKLDFCPSE